MAACGYYIPMIRIQAREAQAQKHMPEKQRLGRDRLTPPHHSWYLRWQCKTCLELTHWRYQACSYSQGAGSNSNTGTLLQQRQIRQHKLPPRN